MGKCWNNFSVFFCVALCLQSCINLGAKRLKCFVLLWFVVFFSSVAMSPLSSRSPYFVSFFFFASKIALTLSALWLSSHHTFAMFRSSLTLHNNLHRRGKGTWLSSGSCNLLFLACPNYHQIVAFNFSQYFWWPSDLLLQILSSFFHCYTPFSLPACISLCWYFELVLLGLYEDLSSCKTCFKKCDSKGNFISQ